MPKKSKKVKTKKVQSKKKTSKKKTVKKKTVKKKVVKKKAVKKTVKKKATKKAVKKKVVKRRRKKKLMMDDVYKILNKVQIGKKKIIFAMFIDEASVTENVIKDLGIRYNKKVMKTQTVFTLFPSDDEDELDILDVDYLDDEIPEDGQIFG